MKPTFLKYDKPILTAMIQCPTPEECIAKIKASIAEGAEALGIQLCKIKREYRTKEHLTSIFESCEGRPIYVTSYRYSESEGYSDEDCANLLLLALDCGATLCDVMGDMFGESPYYQLSVDQDSVEKQKKLIDEIHRRGGEVLMSSHTFKNITAGENIMIAKAQAERGADIIKIVNFTESENDIPEYIEAIQKITAMTDKKLLLLVSGSGRIFEIHRSEFWRVYVSLCSESQRI